MRNTFLALFAAITTALSGGLLAAESPVPIENRPAVPVSGYIGMGFSYAGKSPSEGNFYVFNIVEGGPSQLAGIREGDVIEEIDGLPCVVPDWDRHPINPFKWIGPGDELKLTVRRGDQILPITIKAIQRPYPMENTEELMKVQARRILGEKIFDELAVRGVLIQAERRKDGKLILTLEGTSIEDLEALADVLDGRLGRELGFKLDKGQTRKLRLGKDSKRGFPSLLEVLP